MRPQDYGILLAMIFVWPPFLEGVGSFVGVGVRCVPQVLASWLGLDSLGRLAASFEVHRAG